MIDSIILAGGLGTRMNSSYPKVLHCIGGKPLVLHVVDTLRSVITGKLITVINPCIQKLIQPLINTIFVIQDEPKGTAHAVSLGISQSYAQHVLIAYADVPLIQKETLIRLLSEHIDLSILTFEAQDPTGYGRVMSHGIVEEKDASPEEKKCRMCNSGIMLVEIQLLKEFLSSCPFNNQKQEYYLTGIMQFAIQKKRTVSLVETDIAETQGVNTLFDLSVAESYWQKKIYTQFLLKGVIIRHPETVFFSYDTVIDPGAIVESHVVFGIRVYLTSSAHVYPFCHLEDCKISGSIGPFARIRSGSVVDSGVIVGNFVEIKETFLNSGSKVRHLSYLGNATVGKNANVGAGTITCNYDGFRKFPTTIENESFIGSHTTLIAPVTVGEGVIIGAGSVIRENIAQDTLVRPNCSVTYKKNGAIRFRKRRKI